MSASLRIAVVGAGAIGLRHATLIRERPDCRLSAFVDPAPAEAARAMAEAWGVPLHQDLDGFLHHPQQRPDAVVLATPTGLHVKQALACIAAGMPVLVEKPLAATTEEAQRLLATIAATEALQPALAPLPVLVGHHRRYSSIIEQACEAVASGRLGRLVAVQGSAVFAKPESYFSEAPWRRQRGGGPILTNLVHEIDNLRMLAGEIVQVQAMASNAMRGFEVEDTVAISLRFDNGALGSFLLSDCCASPRSWEQTSGENTGYDHHADEDCYLLAGTQGSLQVPTMRLRSYRGEASWWQPLQTETLAVPAADPMARQLAHFCAVVRREEAPRVTARSAARTLEATLAVARAAATRETIVLG